MGCCDHEKDKEKAPASCCGGEKEPAKAETACCGSGAEKPKEQGGCCGSKPVVSSCCGTQAVQPAASCCDTPGQSFDKLLWISGSIVAVACVLHLLGGGWLQVLPALQHFVHACYDLLASMWLGLLIGIVMVGLLGKVPREFVISILGKPGKVGIVRATLAGVLLDLCSHGILMVGTKLYERGATIGQVIAFLLASPWNSFSLTLILWSLIGLPWTLAFIALSMLVGICTGILFDMLVERQTLPANPNQLDLPDDFHFWRESKKRLKALHLNGHWFASILVDGVRDGRMVLRWAFFGIVLAAAIRSLVPLEIFQQYLGPSALGLVLTVVFATVLEVCSEGSAPIAADIFNRASAPGNSFAFLMAGVSTDYTEVMVLKDTTHSWKIALFLPLLTVPQVLLVAYLANVFG